MRKHVTKHLENLQRDSLKAAAALETQKLIAYKLAL